MSNKKTMKKILIILFLVFLCFLFLFYSNAKNISKNGSNIKNDLKKTKTENINLKSAYNISSSKIPLYFIQNRGQYNKKALFYARTSKYFIWVTKKGLIFDSVGKNKIKNQQKHQYKRDVSRLLFKGANKSPEIVPIDKTKYRVNYFTGKDKSKWK
jgi:predicted ATPase